MSSLILESSFSPETVNFYVDIGLSSIFIGFGFILTGTSGNANEATPPGSHPLKPHVMLYCLALLSKVTDEI